MNHTLLISQGNSLKQHQKKTPADRFKEGYYIATEAIWAKSATKCQVGNSSCMPTTHPAIYVLNHQITHDQDPSTHWRTILSMRAYLFIPQRISPT